MLLKSMSLSVRRGGAAGPGASGELAGPGDGEDLLRTILNQTHRISRHQSFSGFIGRQCGPISPSLLM